MYSINPIPRNVLITPDECTAKLGNTSLDSSRWVQIIELAEVRFIIPLLGWNLYIDIINQKNVQVTSGNIATLQPYFTAEYGTDVVTGAPIVQLQVGSIVNSIDLSTVSAAYLNLWNQALWNYAFNCVYLLALTSNYAQFTSSGVQKSNPLDSGIGSQAAVNVGISLSDLKYLNDRILLDRINPLQQYLEAWICANITQFPLYPIQKCRHRFDKDGNINRTTGFINIYDDCDDDHHRHHGHCVGGNNYYPVPAPTPTPPPFTNTCSIFVTIATAPDGTLYPLCNLTTIQAQYVPGNTLTLPNLVGKYVNAAGALYNGAPVTIGPTNTGSIIGYNQATGVFDRTLQGGFNADDTFQFLYTETM